MAPNRLYNSWNPDDGPLTETELRVMGLVLKGMRNKEIAKRLGCTDGNVDKHLYHIFNKTGCDSRLQLALRFSRSARDQQGKEDVMAITKQIETRVLRREVGRKKQIAALCDYLDVWVKRVRATLTA